MIEEQLAKPEQQDYHLIKRYLLGSLSEEERQRIEDRYFVDPAFLEQIEAVEGDLISDHARGVLLQDEASKVKQQLLTSAYQRQKVEAAKALLAAMERKKKWATSLSPHEHTVGSSWWLTVHHALRSVTSSRKIAFAAVAALVFMGGWMFAKTVRLQRQIETLRAEQASLRQQAQALQVLLAQQQKLDNQPTANPPPENTNAVKIEQTKQQPPPRAQLPIVLTAVSARSDGNSPKQIALRPEIETIPLALNYNGDAYPNYQAVLETYGGEQVLIRTGLKAQYIGGKRLVLVNIPTRPLTNQAYVLRLRAESGSVEGDLSRYSFRINRK